MLNTINNIICYGMGTFACAVVCFGLLGVDPTVSDNTKRICKQSEALATVCKSR